MLVVRGEKMSGMLSRISQREKPCFSLLMLSSLNGEQLVEAVLLMSVQGLHIFDLLKKQTSLALPPSITLLLQSLYVKTLTLSRLIFFERFCELTPIKHKEMKLS